MKNKKMNFAYTFIFVLVSVIALVSCEDPIDLNLAQGEQTLVVEGWIYDRPDNFTKSYVKLSMTIPAEPKKDPKKYEVPVPDAPTGTVAYVRVTNQTKGITYELLRDPNDARYYYFNPADNAFFETGDDISLAFDWNGAEYTSVSKIGRVPVIDAISYRFQDKDVEDGPNSGPKGYYLVYNGPEPCGPGDNYRFKVYKDGVRFSKPEDLIFASDEIVDGNYIGNLEFPSDTFNVGDSLRFEILGIDEQAYRFYLEAQSILFNGGPFSAPLFNVRTNIVSPPNAKRVVGLFGGAGLKVQEYYFSEDPKQPYRGLIGGKEFKYWRTPLLPENTLVFKADGTFDILNDKATVRCYGDHVNYPTLPPVPPFFSQNNWGVDSLKMTFTLADKTYKLIEGNGLAFVIQDTSIESKPVFPFFIPPKPE